MSRKESLGRRVTPGPVYAGGMVYADLWENKVVELRDDVALE